jgi:putative cofactor-binding repeat protein
VSGVRATFRQLASLAVLAGLALPLQSGAVPVSTRAHRGSSAAVRHRGSPAAHAAIVGGMPAEPGTFPWLAAVFHEGPREGFQCTGTVVAPNVVLTAAHCVEDVRTGGRYSARGYAVVTGNVDYTATPRQVLGVFLTVVYPGFDRFDAAGDAALLILSTPTTAPAIALASRPSDSARLAAGRYAVMTGWGETYSGGPSPQELRWARTAVQSPRYCRAHTQLFLAREEMCTLDSPALHTDACFGDSGGPLLGALPGSGEVVELGVASHLYTQCLPSSPAVYTRADLISGWVDDWIASANYLHGTVTSASAPQPSAGAARTKPVPPGSYSARTSNGQSLILQVAANGEWITAVGANVRLTCHNGASLPVSLRWPGDAVFIYSGTASANLPIAAGGLVRSGSASLSARRLAPASLQGQLRVRVEPTSRQLGSCVAQLAFTATR